MTAVPEEAYRAALKAFLDRDGPMVRVTLCINAAVDAAAPAIREAARVELLSEQAEREKRRLEVFRSLCVNCGEPLNAGGRHTEAVCAWDDVR